MISVLFLSSFRYIDKRSIKVHSNEAPWSNYFPENKYSTKANLIISSSIELSEGNYLFKNVQFTYFNSQLLTVNYENSYLFLYQVLFNNGFGNRAVTMSDIATFRCKNLSIKQVSCTGLTNFNYLFKSNNNQDNIESCSIISTDSINSLMHISSSNSTINSCNISTVKECITPITFINSIPASINRSSFEQIGTTRMIQQQNSPSYFIESNFIKCNASEVFFHLQDSTLDLSKVGFIHCEWSDFSNQIDLVSGDKNYIKSLHSVSLPESIKIDGAMINLEFSFLYPNLNIYTYNLNADLMRYRRMGIKTTKI